MSEQIDIDDILSEAKVIFAKFENKISLDHFNPGMNF